MLSLFLFAGGESSNTDFNERALDLRNCRQLTPFFGLFPRARGGASLGKRPIPYERIGNRTILYARIENGPIFYVRIGSGVFSFFDQCL